MGVATLVSSSTAMRVRNTGLGAACTWNLVPMWGRKVSALMYCRGISCAALKEGTPVARALLAASSGTTADATTSPPIPTNCRLERVIYSPSFEYGGSEHANCNSYSVLFQYENFPTLGRLRKISKFS